MRKQTSKEKIDAVLGIKDNQSIDDFLDNIEIDADKIQNKVEQVSAQINEKIKSIDNNITDIKNGSDETILLMSDMQTSMKEIEDLVVLSKQMYKHIYKNICSSDLLDTELISAAAKLLESIHLNIKEFIDLYKDRQKSIEQIQLQQSKQQHDIYMENLKHQHYLERLSKKSENNTIDVTQKMRIFNQDEIIKILDKDEKLNY